MDTAPGALPKYIQISEMLIRRIAAGQLADGARLPPERDMATDLGISVGTLRKALADLADKRLLERVQGSGNYVRARAEVASVYAFFRLEKVGGGGLPTARVLTVDRLEKPAGAPEFGSAGQGHRIRRLRRLDDTVVALEEIWLDGSFDSFAFDDLSESLYLFYRHALGLVIGRIEDRIGVATVPEWAPPDFSLPPGTAAGFIERTGWAQSGDPVEYSRTWFDYNKARYVSRIGKG